MAYTPSNASVTVVNGYPIFTTKDQNGTPIMPSGNYVWNSTSGLWTPWQANSDGNPQVTMVGNSTYASDDGSPVTASTSATPITPGITFNYISIYNTGSSDMQFKVGSGTLITVPAGQPFSAYLSGTSFTHQTASGTTTFNWFVR